MIVGEWIFSWTETIWKNSAWYIDLGLATVSLFLLWIKVEAFWYANITNADYSRTVWLITPLTLTALEKRSSDTSRSTRIFVSVIAVL